MGKEMKNEIVSFNPTSNEKSFTEESQVQSAYIMDFTDVFATEEIFHSRDALVNWAREVGKRNGFVIVIKVSNVATPGIKARVVLACERSGHFKHSKTNDEGPTKKKIKQIGSRKCECPFTLKGKKLKTFDDWMLEVTCGVHNHSAAEYLEGHSFAKRLTEEETKLMVDKSKSMVRPKEILVTLKQRSALNVTTMKTI